MKITKKYLQKLIFEELTKEMMGEFQSALKKVPFKRDDEIGASLDAAFFKRDDLGESLEPNSLALIRELRKRLTRATEEVAANVRLTDEAADALIQGIFSKDPEIVDRLLEGALQGFRRYRENMRMGLKENNKRR